MKRTRITIFYSILRPSRVNQHSFHQSTPIDLPLPPTSNTHERERERERMEEKLKKLKEKRAFQILPRRPAVLSECPHRPSPPPHSRPQSPHPHPYIPFETRNEQKPLLVEKVKIKLRSHQCLAHFGTANTGTVIVLMMMMLMMMMIWAFLQRLSFV